MAANFTTGTLSQADAASLGAAMADKIRDDTVLKAGWSLVEEFTSTNNRWYVLKCAAATSGLPADFYVVMLRIITTGEIRMAICESYNSTTHVMSNMAHAWNQTTGATYDSLGRHPATFTLAGTAWAANTSGNPFYVNWVPSGTSTKYWIIASDDSLTVAMSGTVNGFFNAGRYTWLGTQTNDTPLQITGSSTNDGAITRNPVNAGGTALPGYPLGIYGGGGGGMTNTTLLGVAGDLRYNDKAQGNQRPVAEVGVTNAYVEGSDTTARATYGYLLGKQRRMRAGKAGTAPVGMAFGDAYALQGRLWVPYLATDSRMWDTGLASS